MNGHRHRFRFVDDKRDCDLCVIRFMQGKEKLSLRIEYNVIQDGEENLLKHAYIGKSLFV